MASVSQLNRNIIFETKDKRVGFLSEPRRGQKLTIFFSEKETGGAKQRTSTLSRFF